MALDLFSIEGEHPRSARAITRRFILWTVVCWVSGTPSFLWAQMGPGGGAGGPQFDPWAMALGIMLFAVLYTALTSTDAFDAFQRRRGVRLTLYIGYFTRLGLSVVFPVAMAADLFPGVLSVLAVARVYESLELAPESSRAAMFMYTLLITFIQGTLLNILISIYMLVVYGFVRLSGRGAADPRGFEVVVPEELPEAKRAQQRTDPSIEGSV